MLRVRDKVEWTSVEFVPLVPGFPCLPAPKSASGRYRFSPMAHETERTRIRDPPVVSWAFSCARKGNRKSISRKGLCVDWVDASWLNL